MSEQPHKFTPKSTSDKRLIIESAFCGLDATQVMASLLAILDGITQYSLNGDAWFLACGTARDKIEEMGLSTEVFDAVCDRFQKLRLARKSCSPLACLHDDG